jgi:hypothetical protein
VVWGVTNIRFIPSARNSGTIMLHIAMVRLPQNDRIIGLSLKSPACVSKKDLDFFMRETVLGSDEHSCQPSFKETLVRTVRT